ncbi:MAG: ABC transporter substrate-binding protein [Nitratireductor sp.]
MDVFSRRTLLAATALLVSAFAAPAMVQSAAADEPKKIAIANFGPHGTLEQVVDGFKQALTDKGYKEDEGVVYEYSHGNFDPSLIPQILRSLEATSPDLLMTITTPVTLASIDLIGDKSLPIVFGVVTQPVAAGVVPSWDKGSDRYVGASNLPSMKAVIGFARALLGDVKSFGMLYNSGDVNDVILRDYAASVAEEMGLEFRSESVESPNDIQQRTMALDGVDFIYVIPSSMLQPTVPALASAADRMEIPVISATPDGVLEHVILGAFSISWEKVGYNAGLRAVQILEGAKPSELSNYRPTEEDHTPFISARRLKDAGLELPAALKDCNCVVD